MSEAVITSLTPWFGGKRTMAPDIVRAVGPHSVYWEPFCGSMAVLLAKPQSRTEVVNDLHADLVNLARCVQHPKLGPALYRRLRRVWFSEETFRESHAAIKAAEPCDGLDVDRAFRYFVVSWQGMNGVAGTRPTSTNFARRFSSLGGDPGGRWVGAVRSIPQWRRRLERVQVLNCDGVELCSKIEDREGTVVYADPPYLVKGAKYKHDFTEADHARLAEVLRRFRRTRVVVSYYESPLLTELYPPPRWTHVPVRVAKGLVNQGKRNSTGVRVEAPEVLIVNGRFDAESLLF